MVSGAIRETLSELPIPRKVEGTIYSELMGKAVKNTKQRVYDKKNAKKEKSSKQKRLEMLESRFN